MRRGAPVNESEWPDPKSQVPNPQNEKVACARHFGTWDLGFHWDLGLGTWSFNPHHCASSNGLESALVFGLGSIPIIDFTNPPSPGLPMRTFNGDPFTSVNCDGCTSVLLLAISRNFCLENACGVSNCTKLDGR